MKSDFFWRVNDAWYMADTLPNTPRRANLNTNKRMVKWKPFWNKVYRLCKEMGQVYSTVAEKLDWSRAFRPGMMKIYFISNTLCNSPLTPVCLGIACSQELILIYVLNFEKLNCSHRAASSILFSTHAYASGRRGTSTSGKEELCEYSRNNGWALSLKTMQL